MNAAPADSLFSFQTWLAPWRLSPCVRAVLGRQTSAGSLMASQRWSHYPVSPLCTISCMFEGSASITDLQDKTTLHALPLLSVAGPQSQPRSMFYEVPARGVMVLLYPDAWSALTGVAAVELTDQVLDARTLMPAELLAVCGQLQSPGTDDDRVLRFFDGLQALWDRRSSQLVVGHDAPDAPWAQAMRPWMEALALRAAATGWGRSLRQSERRIKQWTGWSLRRLQGSVRGEAAFLAVVQAMLDDRLNWSDIALDHGFSDQSHFIRETRRLTGFTPEALKDGFFNGEAFWFYRAWAQLAGNRCGVQPEKY